MKLKSKRNYVEKLDMDGKSFVRKHFYSIDDWRTEFNNHALICGRIRTVKIEKVIPGLILSQYLPYPNLLDVLEKQEKTGFSARVWESLAAWLKDAAAVSRILPAEGNLRNFLWDESRREIIAIDLEHWTQLPFRDSAAGIAAFLMEYEPAGSDVKRRACEILKKAWGISEEQICSERLALNERRNRKQKQKDFSMIILAGGKSARMGSNKVQLGIAGKTLLEHQLETAAMLGAGDILISGLPEITGRQDSVADELENRGPLGGIYSCLKQAKHKNCVVLGVDIPLVSAEMLSALLEEHKRGGAEITMAAHGDRTEPMAAVFDASLAEHIGKLIAENGVPVRSLLKNCSVSRVDFPLETLWHNCNTAEAYTALIQGDLTQSVLKNI